MNVIVSALWYTLIKGTKGIWVTNVGDSVEVDKYGIRNDRRFVVIDSNGNFVAQRQGSVQIPVLGSVNIPSRFGAGVAVRTMCQITSHITGSELTVLAPNKRALCLPIAGVSGAETEVKVWRDPVAKVVDQGDEARNWFTEFLSREREGEYRLMRMSDESYRASKVGDGRMGFQDGYPFLAISDSALGELNGKLIAKGKPVVTADRFRPNIWLRGCAPHAEDHFSRIRISGIEFEGMTLCERCSVICTDQETAEIYAEPSATLALYRRGAELLKWSAYESDALGLRDRRSSIFVGRNFNHKFLNGGPHRLRVGDVVEVLETD